ncbi:MAG: Dabb family protein [Planctomycetota bacterium]
MSDFLHIVHFWLREDLSDERRAAFIAAARGLAASENVANCRVGVPAGTDRPVVDNSYDVQLAVTFNDRSAHDAYQSDDDARHAAFIAEQKDCWAKVVIYDSVSA